MTERQEEIEALREVLREDDIWGNLSGHPHPDYVPAPQGHSYRDAVERLLARLEAAPAERKAPDILSPLGFVQAVEEADRLVDKAAPADLVSKAEVLAVLANEATNIQSAGDILTLRDCGGLDACKRIAERITALGGGSSE
jgi:hypothetical protein